MKTATKLWLLLAIISGIFCGLFMATLESKFKVKPTQPTEVKVLDLPEEFDLVTTDDTLMCYTRNDTLFIRFKTKPSRFIYYEDGSIGHEWED